MSKKHEFKCCGGRHVPDELDEALERLTEAFDAHKEDEAFRERYDGLMRDYPDFRRQSTTQRRFRRSTVPKYTSNARTCSTDAHKTNNLDRIFSPTTRVK